MPTYDYQCTNCHESLEVIQKITDDALVNCPSCQKEALRRGPGGGIGLQFKGSGFYCTDYAKPASGSTACCPCGKAESSCSS